MRLILCVLLTSAASVVCATEPDVPLREEKLLRVPAAPISPAEELKRDALTRFGVGFFRTRNDRLVDAMKQYQAVLHNDPEAVAPLRELVKVYAELGRDAAAIRTARVVLAREPDDFETAQRLGRLLVDGKKYTEATEAFHRALTTSKGKDELSARLLLLRELGKAAELSGDFAICEKVAREHLNLLSANKATLLKLASFTLQEFERNRARCFEDLGQALVGLKKYDSASAAFETARDLYADAKAANDRSGLARLHWNLSGSFAAQGEPEQALKELGLYLEQRPAGLAAYERWISLMTESKRTREIPGTLERLARLNPANPAPAWLAAARILESDPAAGHATFRELVKQTDKPEYFRIMVKAYATANRTNEFLDLADQLFTAARPTGHFQWKTGDPELPPAAATDVRRAQYFNEAARGTKGFTVSLMQQLKVDAKVNLSRFPDTLELMMAMATRDGELPKFTPILRDTIRGKTEPAYLYMLVLCLIRQQNWEEIAATADTLSKLNNGLFFPGIAVQAAIAHAEMGHEREALAIVERLDGLIFIRVKRVQIYNILGKHKQALTEIQEVLEKDRPKGKDLRSVLTEQIITLQLLKEDAKADILLRELLDQDPDDTEILNNFGFHLAEQGRKLDEAETMIRRAIDLDRDSKIKNGDPDAESGNYLDSLGWVLFKRGKFPEALKALEQAATFVELSENGIVWDHLGDVYFRLDQKDKAKAAYERAAKLLSRSHEGRQNGRLDEVTRKLGLLNSMR